MTKVMCFGSFDVLHEGHFYFLKEAKKYGEELIVVIARDINYLKFKGKDPKYKEHERSEHVKELSFVDSAVLGDEEHLIDVVEKFKPDIICLGYDQKTISETDLKQELIKKGLKVNIIRMNPWQEHIYKSSKIKEKE